MAKIPGLIGGCRTCRTARYAAIRFSRPPRSTAPAPLRLSGRGHLACDNVEQQGNEIENWHRVAALPNIYCVWGGEHAMFHAHDILEQHSEVDAVAMGEGEATLAASVDETLSLSCRMRGGLKLLSSGKRLGRENPRRRLVKVLRRSGGSRVRQRDPALHGRRRR